MTLLAIAITGAITLSVENASGGPVPETLQVVVYNIGPQGGMPVETLKVVNGKAVVNEPEGAMQVGFEVIYNGQSFFSEPVAPGSPAVVKLYEGGGDISSVAIKLYNVAFFSKDNQVFVAEAIHLDNTGNKVVQGQEVLVLPMPKGYQDFTFMGPEEDYLLVNDTLYIHPNVPPGVYSLGFSYAMPAKFKWSSHLSIPPEQFIVYAEPSIKLSGKNIVSTGQQNLGGMQVMSWQAQDPTKPVEISIGADQSPPWLKAGIIGLIAVLLVVLAWFFINKYTKRNRLLSDLGELEFSFHKGEISPEEYREAKQQLLEQIQALASEQEARQQAEEPEQSEQEDDES